MLRSAATRKGAQSASGAWAQGHGLQGAMAVTCMRSPLDKVCVTTPTTVHVGDAPEAG